MSGAWGGALRLAWRTGALYRWLGAVVVVAVALAFFYRVWRGAAAGRAVRPSEAARVPGAHGAAAAEAGGDGLRQRRGGPDAADGAARRPAGRARYLHAEGGGEKPRVSVAASAVLGDELGLVQLGEVARACVLYVVARCADEAAEGRTRAELERAGVLEAGLLPHHLVFCRTGAGEASVVRHLEPQLAVMADPDVAKALHPHIPELCLVVRDPSLPDTVPAAARNVVRVKSLVEFFAS